VDTKFNEDTGGSSTLILTTSLIDQNHTAGVLIYGSSATVEASVIRGTEGNARGLFGRGVNAQPTTSGVPSTLLLISSVVEQNHEVGVFVSASQTTVEGTLIRDTEPDAQEAFGRGVAVQADPLAPVTLLVRNSWIERSHEVGVFLAGVDATLEASVVRDIRPNAQSAGGQGLHARAHPTTGKGTTLLFHGCLVEQSEQLGIAILGSDASIESSVIRDSRANSNGYFGDGVLVMSEDGPARATLTGTRIDQSARAALSIWGASAAVSNSAFRCQTFDLDFETYKGIAAEVDDAGGNQCGCPDATAPCKAASANLEAPAPLDASQ